MARVSRTGRLNVVVTREGSLSPRSRSGSASPSRGSHHHIDQQLPQQRRAESLQKEVKVLRSYLSIGGDEARASRETAFSFFKTKEKCTELQEKVKTAKHLLDASRVESARLSRLVEVKSRKLHASRKEAARLPVLAAEVSRLREVTGNAESALGKEGKRAEEEKRRSEAWRARVDKLSLQAVQSAERCRTLSAENHQLKEEIERVREHLEEAKRRCSAAGATSNALRLKTIETELLSEELGAVRADCGRLVQLVSSTKEYAEFRRVWDDSGGLTRPYNGGAKTPFFAAKNGVSISHRVITKATASQEEETTESTVSFSEAAPFSGGMPQTTTMTEGPAAAERGTPITRSSDPWEQSRYLSSTLTLVAPTAGGGAASSAEERTLGGRGSRPEGAPGWPTESPQPILKKVSFPGQTVAPPVAAGGGREVHHGVGRELGGSSMSRTGLRTTTPAAHRLRVRTLTPTQRRPCGFLETRRDCAGDSFAISTATAKTAAGGHGRAPTQWGADGRRIRKRGEEIGRRSGTACATACSRNCMSFTTISSGRPQPDKAVGTRLKRTKGRGCRRRAVVGKCQRRSKVGGGDGMASSATLSASNASAGAGGIDEVLRAAAPVGSVGRERYAPDGAAATAAAAAAVTVAEADAVAKNRSDGTECAWRTSSADKGASSHPARYRDFFDQYEDALLAEDRPHRDIEETVMTDQHARTTSAEGEEERHRGETTACSGATSSVSPREAGAGSERRRGGDERQKQGTGGPGAEGGGARHIEQQQRTSSGFSRREAPPPATLASFHTRTRLGHDSLLPPAPPTSTRTVGRGMAQLS
ncbi:hypothetical protein Esi_0078_0048 [Ectocarpus siliculosus]|uniref:Uncharacterized protein n=1 Tax=Ectocarpus siliculosus TaxID=2880 RepID=D8LT42_ECTSI|nr:hypothetical protein Esi_0078_0048 [Ectocarpus siliculosus]|eukprot:CBN75316.1 hypothetical protein Esi_0078_0048 [Ectocarpus siliculosus]